MKSLSNKQKLTIVGVIAAIILCITLAAIIGGQGKDGTETSSGAEGTVQSGEEIGSNQESAEQSGDVIGSNEESAEQSGEELASGAESTAEETESLEYVGPTNPTPAETKPGTIRATNANGEFIQDVQEENIVQPGPGSLREEEIKDYETEPTVVEEEDKEILPGSLEIVSVGKYSGVYVEGGADITVENVASMVVTNTSDQMLQVARFTMNVNGDPEDVALFQVTDLPAGASALIMELNKRPYEEGDVYELGQELHTYYEESGTMSDVFSFEVKDGGLLTLTNLTDQSFDNVYVHYKYVQEGGAYLGGIAYRSLFKSVGPNESVTTSANHFTDKLSVIVRVDVVENPEETE